MVIHQEPQHKSSIMTITGTHFNYYQLCHRKLWLFANGINMEQESDLVYEGKLVHESSYPQRTARYEEVEIDGVKVDPTKWIKLMNGSLNITCMSSSSMALKE